MRRLFTPLAAVLLFSLAQPAFAGEVEDRRADEAGRVLTEILRIPEDSIPSNLLEEAEAIAVIPDVVKASFVVGGRRGRGLIAIRGKDGSWSHPSFITLTGGSFGFQAGVQSADVILVFRSARGVDSIVNGKFTLGADASVAAGPVGRSAQASTDEKLKAEIYSYSRARGLFAGVALDGTRLGIDNKSNQAVYGRGNTARAIFEGRAGAGSDAVIAFRDKLEESTVRQDPEPLN
ncbi:MAG: lipid-binding SYLF domain-containing protein [Arenimonas sp.]|jgi:lipid-binding SYLF domain-containing protein